MMCALRLGISLNVCINKPCTCVLCYGIHQHPKSPSPSHILYVTHIHVRTHRLSEPQIVMEYEMRFAVDFYPRSGENVQNAWRCFPVYESICLLHVVTRRWQTDSIWWCSTTNDTHVTHTKRMLRCCGRCICVFGWWIWLILTRSLFAVGSVGQRRPYISD